MQTKTTVRIVGALALATGLALSEWGLARAVTFVPPMEEGAPNQTTGGASRNGGQCLFDLNDPGATKLQVTPILPQSNYGMTVSERPTILVYLPEHNAPEGLLTVRNEDRTLHYRTIVPISKAEGIVALRIPEEAPGLIEGKNYQWYFQLKCKGKRHPSNPIASGWVKRIEQNKVASRSQSISVGESAIEPSLEKAASLGAAGVWYDTAAMMLQLRQTLPQDREIADNWAELMNSVELEAIANAPIVELP